MRAREADVTAVESKRRNCEATRRAAAIGGATTLDRPQIHLVHAFKSETYSNARSVNRVNILYLLGDVAKDIEIVAPGNRGSPGAIPEFFDKINDYHNLGAHETIVDRIPPTLRAPQRIDNAIADEFRD